MTPLMPRRLSSALVAEVDDEAVVLNDETKEIHRLDKAARFVLEKCDGETSVLDVSCELRATYGVGEEFIWSALGGIEAKGLLAEPWSLPETTRREFITKYGSAAALAPLAISSMLAPAPAEAASRRKPRKPPKKPKPPKKR